MKKISIVVAAIMTVLMFVDITTASATTLKEGVICYSPGSYLAGQPIPLGFDAFGYNYQARMFSGSYFNSYANGAGFPPYEGDDEAYLALYPKAAKHWAWPYRNDQLTMKWNDAWLSNQDRDGDGKLDRHYGFPTYRGSGAWLTNHQDGEYDLDGEMIKWGYFVKIVAAPSDAVLGEEDDGGGDIEPTALIGDTWFNADGREIGPVIWGDFAIIQEVNNDPGLDLHGLQYGSPAGPGVGQY